MGSDLLDGILKERLAAYAAEHDQWSLSIDLFGSMPALEMMRAGEANLAIVAIPDDAPKPSASDFEAVVFAFKIAVIIVKNVHPMVEIDFSQLKGIYGTTGETSYTRWGEMGLTTSGWNNRPIQALALTTEDSVVFELFKYKALDRSPLKSNVALVTTAEELYAIMGIDSAAVAVADRVPQSSQYRALSVASGKSGEIAFGPTAENVFYGDYALRLPLYLVFHKDKKDEIKDLLAFLLSKDISNVLVSDGVMPLPENVRRRSLLELDIEP